MDDLLDEAPLAIPGEAVRPEWIDYNGHMNVAYYILAFDHATDIFFDRIGLDSEYRTGGHGTTFAVESHVTYQRELHEGDPLRFTTQLLGFDQKRLHFFHRMYHADKNYLAATSEWLSLHIDLETRRVGPFRAEILSRFAALMDRHSRLPWPEEAGRTIRRLSGAA